MSSPILRTVSRVAAPAIILYALYLLLVGHDAPGGGFIAGLMSAAALILWALAHGLRARRWTVGLAAGLALALAPGVTAVALGRPFLSHAVVSLAGIKLTMAMVFEAGIFAVVVSAVMAAVQTLSGGGSA